MVLKTQVKMFYALQDRQLSAIAPQLRTRLGKPMWYALERENLAKTYWLQEHIPYALGKEVDRASDN